MIKLNVSKHVKMISEEKGTPLIMGDSILSGLIEHKIAP